MSTDPGPYRFFWASKVTAGCPSCGNQTSIGFNRYDPGVSDREPTKCSGCAADVIGNTARFAGIEQGFSVTEQGPCVGCKKTIHRYGPEGRPACDGCAIQSEPRAGPGLRSEAPAPKAPAPDIEYEPELF